MDAARIEQIKRRTQPGPFYMGAIIASEFEDLLAALAEAQATIQRQAAELAEARMKLAEFDNIEDFPVELQVKCGTFKPDSAPAVKTMRVGVELWKDLQAELSRLRGIDSLYQAAVEAVPQSSDETASLADNIRHMAEELSRLRRLLKDITQAFSPDGCGCIKDIPGDNYTCTAHQRLRKIALDAAKEAGNAGS